MRKIKNNRPNNVAELPISDCLKSSYNRPLPITDPIISTTLSTSTHNGPAFHHKPQIDILLTVAVILLILVPYL